MKIIEVTLRITGVMLVFLLVGGTPLRAQDTADAPIVTALATVPIPVRDRADLARRLLGLTAIPVPPDAPPVYQVGDRADFTITDTTNRGRMTIPATLRAVGTHSALWVQDGQQVDERLLEQLAAAFDARVYPNVRALWGSEAIPGVDGDPRVHGLFARGLGNTTAAYFASDHTYPREVYADSNVREMFFFNLDTIGGASLETLESIVAHEFQHMIRHNLQINEGTWLNEGFSVFTEYLLYGNIDSSLFAYLSQPGTQLTDWNADPNLRGANYGGALLFMIYLYDRFGVEVMHALSADPAPRAWQSVDNVIREQTDAPSADAVFADFVVANLLFDATLSDGQYGYADLTFLMTPPPVATLTQYPTDHKGQSAPYAADYLALMNLDGRDALTIRVDAPPVLPLWAGDSAGYAMYSNRGDQSDTTLTRTFDLSGVESAALDFRLWYDLEEDWDYGYVMASRDGVTWEVLPGTHGSALDPNAVGYGWHYNGVSGTVGTRGNWVDERVSLDDYVGGTVHLRFEVITDDAVTRPGMVIDDVRIDALGYREDFEAGAGDWISAGWLRTDNRVPVTMMVQAVIVTDSGETVVTQHASIGGDTWTLHLPEGARMGWLVMSPLAPVTTEVLEYRVGIGE